MWHSPSHRIACTYIYTPLPRYSQGRVHPTIAGLRIGKKLPERGPEEPYDAEEEWDRDGMVDRGGSVYHGGVPRMSRYVLSHIISRLCHLRLG